MQNKDQEEYIRLAELLFRYAKQLGVDIQLESEENWNVWDRVLADTAYVPIDYARFFVNYQCAYLSQSGQVHDFRVVILHDRKPIGIWPIVILDSSMSGKLSFGTNAGNLLGPLFLNGISSAVRQKIEKALYRLMTEFCLETKISQVKYSETLGPIHSFISTLNSEMTRGAVGVSTSNFVYVDLSMPIESIWANYRKSYKALINSGKKLWVVNLLESENLGIWEEFRQLHIQVAGRETRSPATWELQHASIKNRNGFLVYLRDESGRMIGGGFFQHTREEAVYAVGAYDRSLFDRPVGHVVQHTAILEMQKRQLKWYKLGQRFYPVTFPSPTEKEVAISLFKAGFATHEFVRVDVVTEFPSTR